MAPKNCLKNRPFAKVTSFGSKKTFFFNCVNYKNISCFSYNLIQVFSQFFVVRLLELREKM